MNLFIEETNGIRSYALSAIGFIGGISLADLSEALQILSFIISCLAGLFSIYLHQRQIRKLKAGMQEEEAELEEKNKAKKTQKKK